jgi:hypothetical protein
MRWAKPGAAQRQPGQRRRGEPAECAAPGRQHRPGQSSDVHDIHGRPDRALVAGRHEGGAAQLDKMVTAGVGWGWQQHTVDRARRPHRQPLDQPPAVPDLDRARAALGHLPGDREDLQGELKRALPNAGEPNSRARTGPAEGAM